jgi:uncharacterized protein (DUF302 family)
MNLLNKMMFTVHRSDLEFDETVRALEEAAHKHGWDIPMEHDLQENYQNAGFSDMTRVTTLYFCNPEGGYQVLQDDAFKPMAVMMPMGVSVYETNDGQVYISGMNLKQMSAMFGGKVKEVLQEGAGNYSAALEEIGASKATDKTDLEVKPGKCLLGCLSLTAITTALLGIIIFVMAKIIPHLMAKMMAVMMPEMMDMMKKADVQPPCAQIILERMESQSEAEPSCS